MSYPLHYHKGKELYDKLQRRYKVIFAKFVNVKLFIILLLIALSLHSCKSNSSKMDSFYTDNTGFDFVRVPFIKPYEATLPNGSKEWILSLNGYARDSSVPNIQKANVINGIILLYSTNTIINGADAKESWYIIIPRKNIEKSFAQHQSYKAYLHEIGITTEPKLYDINTISSYFGEYGIVDWDKLKN